VSVACLSPHSGVGGDLLLGALADVGDPPGRGSALRLAVGELGSDSGGRSSTAVIVASRVISRVDGGSALGPGSMMIEFCLIWIESFGRTVVESWLPCGRDRPVAGSRRFRAAGPPSGHSAARLHSCRSTDERRVRR